MEGSLEYGGTAQVSPVSRELPTLARKRNLLLSTPRDIPITHRWSLPRPGQEGVWEEGPNPLLHPLREQGTVGDGGEVKK